MDIVYPFKTSIKYSDDCFNSIEGSRIELSQNKIFNIEVTIQCQTHYNIEVKEASLELVLF